MFLHSLLPSVIDEREDAAKVTERTDASPNRTFLNSLLSRHDDKKANNCVKQECGFSCISTRFHCSKPRGGSGAGIGSDGGRIRTARAEFTQRGDEKVIPADLLPHLSDHQKQGVALAKAAMDKQGAFLLADSTGVGKTRQQIAIAKMYADEGKRVLIVSKSSILQPDWNKKKMSGAFSADGKEMKVGIRLAAQRSDIRKGYVAATTYDRLDKIAGGVGKNTVLILDEAHSFKNRSSDRSRTGIKALERAEKVLYATATPIDKIDHLDYLGRLGVFGDRTGRQFRRFANSKDPDAIGLHSTISERFDSLTKDGLMIRRELTLKGVDVGFTAVKIPKQAKEDMEKTASTYSNNADRAQKLMTQRRQLEPYKIPAATREVNLALKEGRQAIVFVSRVNDSSTPSGVSTATAGALRKQLALAGITDVAELHGSADIDRTEAAKRFQGSKAKVLITTLESGGTGINLDDVVGDKPRTIVMMTPPFSAVENVQAIGRVWRYNTKSMPKVKYLFSDTAVDQWNQTIIETKMRSLEANVKGEINALKIPLPRTDSLSRNPMHSFSLDSLLVFREDKATSLVKTKSGMAKIPGKRCGGGWTKSTNKCKDESTKSVGSSGKKVRKLTPEGKKTAQELAAKVRKLKGLPVLPSDVAKSSDRASKPLSEKDGSYLQSLLSSPGLRKSAAEGVAKSNSEFEKRNTAENAALAEKSKKMAGAKIKAERAEKKAQSAKAKIKPVAVLKAGIKAQKAVAAGDGRAGFEAANEMRANLGLKPAKMSDRAAKTLANREAKLSAKTEQRIAAKKEKAVKAITPKEPKAEKRETGIVGGKASMPGSVKIDKSKVKEVKLPVVKKQADFDKYLKAHAADLEAQHNKGGYIELKDLEDRMSSHGVTKPQFKEMLVAFSQKTNDARLSDSGDNQSYSLDLGGLKRDALSIENPKAFKELPEIESWAKSKKGSKSGEVIEGLEGFSAASMDFLGKSYSDDMAPIHALRSAIGDRVTRKEFNSYLLDLQSQDKIQLMKGDEADLTKDQANNSMTIPGVGPRTFLRVL